MTRQAVPGREATALEGTLLAIGGVERTALAMWGLGALFYGFGFFHRVAPSVMVPELMRDFGVPAAGLGVLSAAYFWAYAVVQVPVGVMVDRVGPKRLLVVASLVLAVGSALFALSGSLVVGGLARALLGAASGVGYVGTLKLAGSWIPQARFGLFAGLTLTAGTLGGILGQVPLAMLVDGIGWRASAVAAALVALLLATLLALVLRDRPAAAPAHRRATAAPMEDAGGLGALLRLSLTWQLFTLTGAIGAPILTFAGLWGVPWLVQVHGLGRAQAGGIVSLLLITWAAGGPLAGWLSDRLGRRSPVLLGGSVLVALAWAVAVLVPGLPLVAVMLCLVVAGLASGVMPVAFALARDAFGNARAGTAAGIVNSSVLLAGAAVQIVVGALLDLNWSGQTALGVRVYGGREWQVAMAILPCCGLLASIVALIVGRSGRHRR
ncbi:MAG TPA: MFS transporter [Geminicoccus sp.]|nr:MFS transporter [Geminicoccus sp.]